MEIGNLIIDGRLFMPPLAGVSKYPLRYIARKFGASFCYTEMVSADALSRNQEKTLSMLDMTPDEHPVGVQLFGSKPEYVAKAVKIIEQRGPDLIDINIGCPVGKVVRKNGGAALLKNPTLAGEIMAAAVENCGLPITIKMRSGWNKENDTYLEFGQIAEKAGIAAIAFHARSRSDHYRDKSDWSKIARLKEEVSIPVIGNGDIATPQDAKNMLEQTGCDAVMIGRAAMKKPHIFYQIKRYLEDGEIVPDLSIKEQVELILEHTRLMISQFGERGGVLMMRKHLAWYTLGFRQGGELRNRLMKVETVNDITTLFDEYTSQNPVSLNE